MIGFGHMTVTTKPAREEVVLAEIWEYNCRTGHPCLGLAQTI